METKKLDFGQLQSNQAMMKKGRVMHFERGGRFLVAFLGIAAFGRRLDLLKTEWLFKHGKKKSAIDEIPEEVNDRLTARALYGTVLLGWWDVELNGAELPFTEENVVLALCGGEGDPDDVNRFWGVPGLTTAIMEFSKRIENFERANREDSKSDADGPPGVGAEVGVAPSE